MGSAHVTATAMSLTLAALATTPRRAWPVRRDVCSAWMLANSTSAFKGEPSWKTTPGRNVIVHTDMSVLGVTDCAR